MSTPSLRNPPFLDLYVRHNGVSLDNVLNNAMRQPQENGVDTPSTRYRLLFVIDLLRLQAAVAIWGINDDVCKKIQ